MKNTEYNVKNFAMRTEIEIAGRFIYNGLAEFNRIRCFRHPEEIFSFLYNVAVGLERLQKATLVLLENPKAEQFEQFEISLKTHSHQKLHERIKKQVELKLNKHQTGFLELLSDFYNTCRYNRFTFETEFSAETKRLIQFLESKLEITIDIGMLTASANDSRIKQFIGRVVGGLASKYYEVFRGCCEKLGLYGWELYADMPAAKLFWKDFRHDSYQEQFESEKTALREFLIYLINTQDKDGLLDFMRGIKPLNFDPVEVREYLEDIIRGTIPQSLIDMAEEMHTWIDDKKELKERLEMLKIIGDRNIHFPSEDDATMKYIEKWEV